MVDAGILQRHGQKRGSYYTLTDAEPPGQPV
jgi:hypothetical protein